MRRPPARSAGMWLLLPDGDFFTLDYIRDRILHTLDPAEVITLNTELQELAGTVGDGDFPAAGHAAEKLRQTVAGLGPAA